MMKYIVHKSCVLLEIMADVGYLYSLYNPIEIL